MTKQEIEARAFECIEEEIGEPYEYIRTEKVEQMIVTLGEIRGVIDFALYLIDREDKA